MKDGLSVAERFFLELIDKKETMKFSSRFSRVEGPRGGKKPKAYLYCNLNKCTQEVSKGPEVFYYELEQLFLFR